MKVMIVDDNAGMRTLIRSLLGGVAQEFVECADGQDAVAMFPAELPDWTVMDIVMPGMDGLVATRRIMARFPAARILIITQHQNPKLREAASEAGATDLLNKEDLTQLETIITGSDHAGEIAACLDKGEPVCTSGAAAVALAPLGTKPGVVMADTVRGTVKITAIDATTRKVTFVNSDGKSKTLKVGDHIDLTKVKAGDSVTIRQTEAMAITVEKP